MTVYHINDTGLFYEINLICGKGHFDHVEREKSVMWPTERLSNSNNYWFG